MSQPRIKTVPLNEGDVNIVSTMVQAASLIGASRDDVKRAKKGGCLAFRGNGSVHIPTLKQWLADNPQRSAELEDKASAEARLMRAKADRAEAIVKQQKRELIPVDEVKRTYSRAVIAFKTRLLAIPDNLSQRIAVIDDATAIREMIRLAVNDALDELSKCEWSTKHNDEKEDDE